ncbi:MAG TPA: hypothetical protein VF769_18310, partial [Vitreimonas sp.]
AASHALAHEAQQLAQLVARFDVSRSATQVVSAPKPAARPAATARPTPPARAAAPPATVQAAPPKRANPAPVTADTPAPKRANPVLQQQERLAAFAAAKPTRRVSMSPPATKVESWEEF